MSKLPAGFTPTLQQTGRALGRLAQELCERLLTTADTALLQRAQLSRVEYADELLLVAACAAMHTIEQSASSVSVERGLTEGFVLWLHELPAKPRELLQSAIDEMTDVYADAAGKDNQQASVVPPDPQRIAELELVVADRLYARGEDCEARGHACIQLALLIPPLLWSHTLGTARRMLLEAGFSAAVNGLAP